MSGVVRRVAAVVLTASALAVLTSPTAWAGLSNEPTGVVATAGNLQASLSWTAPSSNGGETITDYIIEYSPDGGTTFIRFMDTTSTATTVTVTGLTNGTAYQFRVSAVVNVSGQGPASVVASATPVANHTAGDLPQFSACPPGAAPAAGFGDTASTDVDCIKMYGITNGTTATTYSPYDPVSRWQMALFLTRMATRTGVTLPDGSDQGFTDIGSYSTEIRTAINQIKQLGITVGKTADTYAPADNVTREEMALFITRFLKDANVGPGGTTNYVSGTSGPLEIKSNDTDYNFIDIDYWTITMEVRNAIVNLWNLGVTDVQDVVTFEPTAVMTRVAMATFITNALAHTNARPVGLVLQPDTYRAAGSPIVYFSVTHRDVDFSPIVGTRVDTFKFQRSVVTGIVSFDSLGWCSSTVATQVGNLKCNIDSSDPLVDANGNLATFFEVMPTVNIVDVWAWTADLNTLYNDDLHATGASKVTVETHA